MRIARYSQMKQRLKVLVLICTNYLAGIINEWQDMAMAMSHIGCRRHGCYTPKNPFSLRFLS